jgi:periplasmic copper chaperone A
MRLSLFVFAFLLALPAVAAARSYTFKGLEIDQPYATPTVAAAPTGAVYLTIVNRGKEPDRLLGGSTSRAKRVELHSMSMQGDVMRMRHILSIDLNPGEPVVMRPSSSHHVMLSGLTAPLKVGDRFPLTLRFEKAGTLKVEVVVEQPKPAAPAHQH